MPALLRYQGSAGAQPCQGRSSLDRALLSGRTWQLSGSTDKHDQPNQSVHAFRGTAHEQLNVLGVRLFRLRTGPKLGAGHIDQICTQPLPSLEKPLAIQIGGTVRVPFLAPRLPSAMSVYLTLALRPVRGT
jgi:hypothetical protein